MPFLNVEPDQSSVLGERSTPSNSEDSRAGCLCQEIGLRFGRLRDVEHVAQRYPRAVDTTYDGHLSPLDRAALDQLVERILDCLIV